MHSFSSFAVALSYGLATGSVVFLAGLKMIGHDDDDAVRAQLEPTTPNDAPSGPANPNRSFGV